MGHLHYNNSDFIVPRNYLQIQFTWFQALGPISCCYLIHQPTRLNELNQLWTKPIMNLLFFNLLKMCTKTIKSFKHHQLKIVWLLLYCHFIKIIKALKLVSTLQNRNKSESQLAEGSQPLFYEDPLILPTSFFQNLSPSLFVALFLCACATWDVLFFTQHYESTYVECKILLKENCSIE